MQLDMSDTSAGLYRSSTPLSSIRWTAILAGLVVGIATHLLLMLLGASVGLAAVDVTNAPEGATIPAAVGLWNTLSMLIAAFVGGYVAARSAGLRRSSDGILHGVVSWGVTMLVTAFLATTAAGTVLGTFFSSPTAKSAAGQAASQAAPAAPDVARSISEGDRQGAINTLQSRLGLSGDQAAKIVDQALIASGKGEQASPEAQDKAQNTVEKAAMASGWLTGAILLSLLAAIGGGWLGARGTHRVLKPQLHRHEVVHHDVVTDAATGRTVRTE